MQKGKDVEMNKKNHTQAQLVNQIKPQQKKHSWLQALLERREDCGKPKKGKNCNG